MHHDYKITDFQCVEAEDITDLKESVVSVALNNTSPLPECIVSRMENIINRMISEHEEKTGLVIPLADMDLEMHIDADTMRGELSLNAYISYSLTEEFMTAREIVGYDTDDAEEYFIIKKYYIQELVFRAFRCVEKILHCI